MNKENNTDFSSELAKITEMSSKNAAKVLSKMLKTDVQVLFSKVQTTSLDELLDDKSIKGKLVSFVFSHFHGDAQGIAALLLPEQSTLITLELLFNRKIKSLEELEEIDYSVLKETGNILISSFLCALCDKYNIVILSTVPDVAVDFLPSILDEFLLILLSEKKEQFISIKTELATEHQKESIFGSLMFFFEPTADFERIFKRNSA